MQQATDTPVFGTVVSYDWPADFSIGDEELKATAGIVRLYDGRELPFNFGQGVYPEFDERGALDLERSSWLRGMNWVIPGSSMAIYLDEQGQVHSWHWVFDSLQFGFWSPDGRSTYTVFFRVIDAQTQKCNGYPWIHFQGTLEHLMVFMSLPDPPASSGRHVLQERKHSPGGAFTHWEKL